MSIAGRSDVRYRPEIDGLRCLAVIPVILYHANIWPFTGGYVGVDIFFVISGYLITAILLNDLGQGKFSFANFYERRIRRIFPALSVVTASTFAASWFILSPAEMQDFSQSVVATMAFASNVFFFLKSGYFTPDVETYPLIHMWSLAVEEQFYIVFPALLLLLNRYRRVSLTAVLMAILLASLLMCIVMQRDAPTANFFLPFARAWELMAGAIIAANDSRVRSWFRARPPVAGAFEVAGLLLILGSILLYDRSTPFPGWAAIPPVLGSVLIIGASRTESIVGRVLSTKVFVGIGLLSYSAYLWHQPLFALARSHSGFPLPIGVYAGLIALTFAASYLSWRFIETPFRSRAFLKRKTLILVAASLSALLAAAGALGHITRGFPARYSAQQLGIAETMEFSPKREVCHTDGLRYRRPEVACRYFGPNVTWATLGDSHSVEFGYALAERIRSRREGVLHLSFSSCQPALQFDTYVPGCHAWLREATEFLEREGGIKNVLLAFRHSFYLYGDQRDSYPKLPDGRPLFLKELSASEARVAYWGSFQELVRRLQAAGKHIYIVEPVPELPTAADYFVFKTKGGDPMNQAGSPLAYYRMRQGPVLAELQKLASWPGVTLLEPAAALCSGQGCAAIADGQALYLDDNHLSMNGTRRVLAFEGARGKIP